MESNINLILYVAMFLLLQTHIHDSMDNIFTQQTGEGSKFVPHTMGTDSDKENKSNSMRFSGEALK